MSLGAGRLEGLVDVASERVSLTEASQVVKGLPSMPAHDIPVSVWTWDA